jgi:chromosome segregation ATPase
MTPDDFRKTLDAHRQINAALRQRMEKAEAGESSMSAMIKLLKSEIAEKDDAISGLCAEIEGFRAEIEGLQQQLNDQKEAYKHLRLSHNEYLKGLWQRYSLSEAEKPASLKFPFLTRL